MALQYSITAVGAVILQSAVNTLGSAKVAAIAAAQKLSMFFTQPMDMMGSTMATFSGQNLGAGKIDRIFKGIKRIYASCYWLWNNSLCLYDFLW